MYAASAAASLKLHSRQICKKKLEEEVSSKLARLKLIGFLDILNIYTAIIALVVHSFFGDRARIHVTWTNR